MHVHKVHSTPDDPGRAMVSGLVDLCGHAGIEPAQSTRSSTARPIATNAVLEHVAPRAGMLTTEGFRDVVHIGRHQRPQHYSIIQDIPWQARPLRAAPPPQDRARAARAADAARSSMPLDEDEVRARRARAARGRASSRSPSASCSPTSTRVHERARRRDRARGASRLRSSPPRAPLFPQFREFERFTTAAMNAFVGPSVALPGAAGRRAAAERRPRRAPRHASNGGVAPAAAAAAEAGDAAALRPGRGRARRGLGGRAPPGRERPHHLRRRRHLGRHRRRHRAAASAEASARDTGSPAIPLIVPMIDIHTIGAGGGSIAYVDEGGAFRVGPRSAGAGPGPACYGRGGTEPTVTDANVVLGRLDPERFLGGEMRLDRDAPRARSASSRDALGLRCSRRPRGSLTHRQRQHGRAIRSRRSRRAIDPRRVRARGLRRRRPAARDRGRRDAGHARGHRAALPGHHLRARPAGDRPALRRRSRTEFMVEGAVDRERLDRDLARLAARAARAARSRTACADEVVVERAGSTCRYVGQGYELRVSAAGGALHAEALEEFHRLHEQEYGHAFRDPIELVNLRVDGLRRAAASRAAAGAGQRRRRRCWARATSVFGRRTARPTRFSSAALPVGDVGRGRSRRLPARHHHGRPAGLDRAERTPPATCPHARSERARRATARSTRITPP